LQPDRKLPLRPSSAVLVLAVLLLGAFAWTLVEGLPARGGASQRAAAALTRELGLTDLALVTEARYLRHIALADRGSAFQDHPLALEHFPSGALLQAPAHLRAPDGAGFAP
jgi:hypothetical protein